MTIRAPLITRTSRVVGGAGFVATASLSLLAASPTPVPFAQLDWPNPRLPARAAAYDQGQVNLLETTLGNVAAAPQVGSAQGQVSARIVHPQPPDPPNTLLFGIPVLPPIFRAPLLTRIAQRINPAPTLPFALNLLATTLVPATNQPAASYDDGPTRIAQPGQPPHPTNWLVLQPIPVASIVFTQGVTRVLRQPPDQPPNLVLLQPAAAVPFAPVDWTVAAKTQPQKVDQPPNLLLPVPAISVPFAQYDWKNPVALKGQQARQPVNVALAAIAPFVQTDWRIPLAVRGQAPQLSPNLLLGSVAAPFAALDWPNPRTSSRTQAPLQQNLLETTLLPFIVAGRADAQPTIIRRIQPLDPANVLPLAAIPFTPTLFPQPLGRRNQPIDQPPNLVLGAIPFAQSDWRNPIARRGQAPDHAQSFVLWYTALPVPFAQHEWTTILSKFGQQHYQPLNLVLGGIPPSVIELPHYVLKAPSIPRIVRLNQRLPMLTGPLPYAEYFMRVGEKNTFGIDWADWLANRWAAGELVTAGFVIRPTTPNGFQYPCTVAGESGGVEPTWPTPVGAAITEGSVSWVCEDVDTTSLSNTVQSSVWVAPAGVIITSPTVIGQITGTLLDVTGAVAGTDYLVNNVVTMSDGEVAIGQLKLKVR
jgi:hypothetical protein